MLLTKAVGPVMEAAGQRGGSSTSPRSRDSGPDRFVDRLCRLQRRALIHLTKCMAVGARPRGAGELRGARPASRARARERRNLRPEQVAIGRKASLLGKAADKDDRRRPGVVTMCRTNTMTGQTLVIDSGRTFH